MTDHIDTAAEREKLAEVHRYKLVHGEPEYRSQMLVRPDGVWVPVSIHRSTVHRLLDALDARDGELERMQEALEKIRYWDWQVAEPHGADIPENVEPWARELDDACTQMQRIARAALNGEGET